MWSSRRLRPSDATGYFEARPTCHRRPYIPSVAVAGRPLSRRRLTSGIPFPLPVRLVAIVVVFSSRGSVGSKIALDL